MAARMPGRPASVDCIAAPPWPHPLDLGDLFLLHAMAAAHIRCCILMPILQLHCSTLPPACCRKVNISLEALQRARKEMVSKLFGTRHRWLLTQMVSRGGSGRPE